jgi:PST family polysaccharide transporter
VEERAIRGVSWTLVTYAGPKVLSVGTTIVLARLLDPADFGLLALAVLAIGLMTLFRDLGLGATVVLQQRRDAVALGTSLTLILATAAVSTIIVVALAPVAADLFDEPRLTGPLTVLALPMILNALGAFHQAILQRELEFRRRFTISMVRAAIYSAVALTLAFALRDVWSLIIAEVVGTVVFCVLSVALSPQHVRPRFDRTAARQAISSGQGFLVQGTVAFVNQNVDYLAVGRLLGAAQLGYYSMAYRLSELPYLGIADPVAKVTFPAFARMRERGEDVGKAFLSVLRLVAVVTCPLGVLLSGAAEPFTATVLGSDWLPMVGALAVMGIWGALRTVEVTIAWLLNSVGQAAIMGLVSILSLLLYIPTLFLAAEASGIVAVAWVVVGNLVLTGTALAVIASRRAGVPVREQWRAIQPAVLACVAAWPASRLVADATGDLPPALSLAAASAAGLAAYLLVLFVADRTLPKQAAAQMARALGRSRATAPGDA